MEKIKSYRGITLIALTITIVVMLILSSIVISSINGGDTQIERASDSKIYTELKQMKTELEQYKVNKYGNTQLKEGNFSGELSSEKVAEYLKTDGIVVELTGIAINKENFVGNANEDKTNRTIGIINTANFAQKLRLKNKVVANGESESNQQILTIGNNYNSYNSSSSISNLKDFNDVFVIDLQDETLYYVNDGKIWTI